MPGSISCVPVSRRISPSGVDDDVRRDVDRTHVVDIADDLIGLDGLAGFPPQWVRGLSQPAHQR